MSNLNTLLIKIEDEPLIDIDKCKPLLIDSIDKFLQMIIQQEYVDDKLSWFAINLYLSKFIRLVIYPEIQMLWPILLRTTVLPMTLEYCTRLLNVLCATIPSSLGSAQKSC